MGLLGDDGYDRRKALHNYIKIGHWRNVLELNSCPSPDILAFLKHMKK